MSTSELLCARDAKKKNQDLYVVAMLVGVESYPLFRNMEETL
jgi:hypothetical protein